MNHFSPFSSLAVAVQIVLRLLTSFTIALAEGWVQKDGKGIGKVDLVKTQASLGIDHNRLRMLQATFENTIRKYFFRN